MHDIITWEQLFSAANLLALVAWAILILAPRRQWILRTLFYGPVFLLALTYMVVMIGLFVGVVPSSGGMDFGSIAGVRSIFASDAGVTIGWIHYLCFDLFVGLWIARNADGLGINRLLQAPILLLTFMLGPIGLASYIIARFSMRRGGKRNRLPA